MSARGKSVSINCKFNSARGICPPLPPRRSTKVTHSQSDPLPYVTARNLRRSPLPSSVPAAPSLSATVAVTPLGLALGVSWSTSWIRNWQSRKVVARACHDAPQDRRRSLTSTLTATARSRRDATWQNTRVLVRSRIRGYTWLSHSRKRPRSAFSSIQRATRNLRTMIRAIDSRRVWQSRLRRARGAATETPRAACSVLPSRGRRPCRARRARDSLSLALARHGLRVPCPFERRAVE